jgi:hypothetical protein
MKEEWKPFPPQPEILVSSLGRIKGIRGGVTFGQKTQKGYLSKVIRIKGVPKSFKVHRMVLLTFKGPSELVCNHINGIKHDNRLENLEYVTSRENQKHAYKTGLKKPLLGDKAPSSTLPKAKLFEMLDELNESPLGHRRKVIRKYGISDTTIYRILKGLHRVQDFNEWKNNLNGPFKIGHEKQACKHGHSYNGPNLRIDAQGNKFCRSCNWYRNRGLKISPEIAPLKHLLKEDET